MEETRSMTVAPSEEQAVTELWQDFGWSLAGNQEINVVDNHLERKGDEIRQVRNQEIHIKLTFKRNTSMPHYAEIKGYETQFSALKDEPLKRETGALWLIVLGIICTVAAFAVQLLLLIGSVVFFGGGTTIMVLISKKNKGIRARNAERAEKKMQLRQASRALLQ